MKFLLDTNILIDFFHNEGKSVKLLTSLEDQQLFVSVITVLEITIGAHKTKTPERYIDQFNDFLDNFGVASLPLDDIIAAATGKLIADVERKGNSITGFDAIIAATAQYWQCTLVTGNRAFGHIADLKIKTV